MAKGILKGLAVAAGTGLAMGLNPGRVRVRTVARVSAASPDGEADDEFLDIESLLDRLERVEARVESMELLADLDRRVAENTRDLALLRKSIAETEQRLSASVGSVERRVTQTLEEMPALVDQQVASRIGDLQSRLEREIEQAQKRTLETFERAIDEKIASRIGSLERALAAQAGSIAALGVRTAETDNNLQRLVTAIERLCERVQLMPSTPAKTPTQNDARLPFESQLNDAMDRAPVVPVLLTAERETEAQVAAPTKSRFLFRNLL